MLTCTKFMLSRLGFLTTLICSIAVEASGQDAAANPEPNHIKESGLPNLKSPTLGGKQLWTDHQWRAGWRVQQNVLTRHWRLLDPENRRHAWGKRDACQRLLDEQVPQSRSEQSHLVVLLHGLGRSAASMRPLGDYLQANNTVGIVYFEYASTRGSIGDHAAAFGDVIDGLPEEAKLSFVGHSMGNIVVRHCIGDWMRERKQQPLDRLQCAVMLGPPNQGSSIARLLSRTSVFGWVLGKGGLELGPEWEELEKKLATPPMPFGIIAGRLPDSTPANPLVEGSGDFVVSVEETRLEGAADFLEVPRLHTFIMSDQRVHRAVSQFLKTNRFGPQ